MVNGKLQKSQKLRFMCYYEPHECEPSPTEPHSVQVYVSVTIKRNWIFDCLVLEEFDDLIFEFIVHVDVVVELGRTVDYSFVSIIANSL